VPSVDVSIEVEADGGYLVTLQTPEWELNIQATKDELRQLTAIRDADWVSRRSICVGVVAGSAAYWSSDGRTATVVVGHDDETRDLALTMPVEVVDEVVMGAREAEVAGWYPQATRAAPTEPSTLVQTRPSVPAED
jgi:hypothetical protein